MRRAGAMLIATGAGMGVDSGLPDFRGPEGFWRAYPPMERRGLTFPQVSTPSWFGQDPPFAWGFFGHRYALYTRTRPHRGFEELLKLAMALPGGYFVITSNVDGHFQKAGYDPNRIYEVHGTIHEWQCRRGCPGHWPANQEIAVDAETFRAEGPLPRCPTCRAVARPNILMFNDVVFDSTRLLQQACRYDVFVRSLLEKRTPLVVVEIGAGKAVPTIRAMTEQLMDLMPEAFLYRINPTDSDTPSRFRSRSQCLALTALEGIAFLQNSEK